MAQVDHGDIIATERSSVVVSDESKTSTTDVEEQLQLIIIIIIIRFVKRQNVKRLPWR